MTIKIIFFCCILLSATNAISQNVLLTWGNTEKSSPIGYNTKIAGRDATGFYVLSHKTFGKDAVYLEKFDNSGNQIFNKELTLPTQKGEETTFENMIMLGDQLMLFTSFYDKDAEKNYAFVNKISTAGILNKSAKKIDEITAKSKRKRGEFKFILSQDSTKILIYHAEATDGDEPSRLGIKVIDKTANILWQKSVTIPYKRFDFIEKQFVLSRDNKAYILATIHQGSILEKRDGKPTYYYTILSYSEKDEKEYAISLNEKFISQISMDVTPESVVCAGLYSMKNSIQAGGAFYLKLNRSNMQKIAENRMDFSAEILDDFVSEKKANKETTELKNYELRKLIPRGDDVYVIVAEQYYKYDHASKNSSNPSYTNYTYHYNDILTISIADGGKINWVTRIPKRQVSTDEDSPYSSFGLFTTENEIYLVYNDSKENIGKYDPKKIVRMHDAENSAGMIVSVNAKGEYTKKAIFDNIKKDAIAKPRLYLQTNKNELIIQAEKYRNYMYGLIKVN